MVSAAIPSSSPVAKARWRRSATRAAVSGSSGEEFMRRSGYHGRPVYRQGGARFTAKKQLCYSISMLDPLSLTAGLPARLGLAGVVIAVIWLAAWLALG